MLIDTTRVLVVGALLASGCARLDFDPDTIGVDIQVASPASAESPALYRASAKGDAARSAIEYFAAFGAAADRQCAGAPVRGREIIDVEAPIKDGEPLSMAFSCVTVTLPNHSDLPAAQFHADPAEPAPGIQRKQGWATSAGVKQRAFNELIGDFARQAYADECAGGPVLIEHIQTATEVISTAVEASGTPRVRVIVDYRCVSGDAYPPPVKPRPHPASAT